MENIEEQTENQIQEKDSVKDGKETDNKETNKEINNTETNKVKNTEQESKKKRSFFSRNWAWILSTSITAVFMLVVMIVQKVAPFGEETFTLIDSIHQYVPFLSDYQDKLQNHGSLLYTWDVGLGQNFQSLLLYYMASPFNIVLFFVSRKNIVAVFSLLVSLKLTISAGTFSYFLSRRRGKCVNNSLIVVLGIAFALNNYMISYYWNVMWLDCIMVLPLIMLGYERLIQKSDPRLYIVSLFYCMYCNYYIAYIICVFLILWFLLTGHKNFKKFITDGLKFAGCSLLSAGMAAVSLLVAYFAISKTATAGAELPKWNWYQSFWDLLGGQFFLTKPIVMDSFDGKANLYAGTLSMLMLFIYILSNKVNIWEKLGRIVLLFIFIISMNQELLNFIWHGFHNQFGIPNRFSFLYIFTLLVICYEMVVKSRDTSTFSILGGVALSAGFILLCYHFGGIKGIVLNEQSQKITVAMSLLFVSLYGVLLILRHYRIISVRANTVIIGIIFGLEIIVNGAVGIAAKSPCDGHFYLKYTELMENATDAVHDIAEKDGHIFYREEVVDPIMLDENTYNNMRNVGTFCSTVRGSMIDAMASLGYYTAASEYIYMGSTPVTNDLLGVRYIYLRDGTYFPWSENMKPVYTTEGLVVYENEYALPIAFGMNNSVKNQWTFDSTNSAMILNRISFYGAEVEDDIFTPRFPVFGVAGDGCDITYDSKSANIIGYSNATGKEMSIRIVFEAEEDGRHYINIRGNNLKEVDYMLNDMHETKDRYYTQMMDLGELKKGDKVDLNLTFNSMFTENGTLTTYTSILNEDALAEFRDKLSRNQMDVTEFRDGYLKGSINLDGGQMIFTTVPYDEGWKVLLDGKKVEPVKLCDAFIGIEAEPGQHTVELKYMPPGFLLGICISAGCWIIYIFIVIMHHLSLKKKVKKSII